MSWRSSGSMRSTGGWRSSASRSRASPSAAVHVAAGGRKVDLAHARVVELVRLVEVVLGVGAVDEPEATAEAADADPLLVVAGRIDVGPADRCAEGAVLLVRVLTAAGVDAMPRSLPVPRMSQVAQAVVDLWAGADELIGVAVLRVDGA